MAKNSRGRGAKKTVAKDGPAEITEEGANGECDCYVE